MRPCGSAEFVELKMTKTNHKPNTDPNLNPNTRHTLILIIALDTLQDWSQKWLLNLNIKSVKLIIIIIINDNVYGAILMTMVTARVHPIHLMNAD